MTNSGTADQIQQLLTAYGLPYTFTVDATSGNATFTSGPYAGQHIILAQNADAGANNRLTLYAVPTDGSGDITVVSGPTAGQTMPTSPSIGIGTILLGTLLVGIPLPSFGGGGAVAGGAIDGGTELSGDTTIAGTTAAGSTAAASSTTAGAVASSAGSGAAVATGAAGASVGGVVATVNGVVAAGVGIARAIGAALTPTQTQVPTAAGSLTASPLFLIVGAIALVAILGSKK